MDTSQKSCLARKAVHTAEDGKFEKTLMADLFCQARQPMIVTSANAAYCYDWVNEIIMSLVWLVLTKGNIPDISGCNDLSPDNEILPGNWIRQVKPFFGGQFHFPCMMGLGQEGNRASPRSWIQLSAVMVNVFKQLNLRAMVRDPITVKIVHSMGALFVDDTDLYPWRGKSYTRGNCGARHR